MSCAHQSQGFPRCYVCFMRWTVQPWGMDDIGAQPIDPSLSPYWRNHVTTTNPPAGPASQEHP